MFILSIQNLTSVYLCFSTLGLIVWSYICNEDLIYFVNQRVTLIAYDLLTFNVNSILKVASNLLLQVNTV